MREFRVYGGPGCGKTTYLSGQIAKAVDRFGPRVLVCSFSNAAANELVTRDLPLPSQMVGTLHSFCRRSLGGARRDIAETSPKLKEWNDKHPAWQIPHSSRSEPTVVSKSETRTWTNYGVLRNRMIPQKDWPLGVARFHEKWRGWKIENELVDFTDLIEIVSRERLPCPYDIEVLFADEAQDYSALEMSVVRGWGSRASYFVLAGDDQQALYDFRGASATAMLYPEIPPGQVTILDQSFRLPSRVLEYARAFGDSMEVFQPKDVKPVRTGGEVMSSPSQFRSPETVDLACSYADGGETVMVLASCAYMLTPVIAQLRERGRIFWNPYRPSSSTWNPGRGGFERVSSFILGRSATWSDAWRWFEHLDARKAGVRRGGKLDVSKQADAHGDDLVDPERFEDMAGFAYPDPDAVWLFSRILGTKRGMYRFAEQVYRIHGVDGFDLEPSIVVGTYHSVKGGEADVVIMSPELSDKSQGGDPVRRMMYVGMTRAKNRVILMGGKPPVAELPEAAPYQSPQEVPVPF